MIAHKLLETIKARATTSEVMAVLDDVPNPTQESDTMEGWCRQGLPVTTHQECRYLYIEADCCNTVSTSEYLCQMYRKVCINKVAV